MQRPVHFEIHAADPERAARFYRDLLDWEITRWEGPVEYWLVTTGSNEPGIDGAIVKRPGANPDPAEPTPVVGYVNILEVADIDDVLTRADRLGATLAMPKTPIPGIGWVAYLKDTESNVFGLMQGESRGD